MKTLPFFQSIPRKYWILIFSICISAEVSAQDAFAPESLRQNMISQDYLDLTHMNGERMYRIELGQIVRVWGIEKSERGIFVDLRKDTVSINQRGMIIKYHIHDIRKIKAFGNSGRVILGTGLKIWGGAIIVAGFVAPLSLGPGGLIISVPAWAVGYGIYRIGGFVSGDRKFNLEKNWRIK